jgi:hypothetical protein
LPRPRARPGRAYGEPSTVTCMPRSEARLRQAGSAPVIQMLLRLIAPLKQLGWGFGGGGESLIRLGAVGGTRRTRAPLQCMCTGSPALRARALRGSAAGPRGACARLHGADAACGRGAHHVSAVSQLPSEDTVKQTLSDEEVLSYLILKLELARLSERHAARAVAARHGARVARERRQRVGARAGRRGCMRGCKWGWRARQAKGPLSAGGRRPAGVKGSVSWRGAQEPTEGREQRKGERGHQPGARGA